MVHPYPEHFEDVVRITSAPGWLIQWTEKLGQIHHARVAGANGRAVTLCCTL